MSGRGLTPSLIAAIESTGFRYSLFVKLEFDSGTIYLHNGVGVLTWDSNDWQGVGDLGGIEPVEEGTELSPYSLVLTLSGLDADLMDEVMNQDYYLRPVTMYFGALDSAGALVADPDELWSGDMQTADVALGTLNGIRLTCESEFAMFERANNSRYSDTHLQREFSGDLFLQYAEQMEERQVVWGGSAAPFGQAIPTDFDEALGGEGNYDGYLR